MNIKKISVNELPGYDDQHRSVTHMSEEAMAIVSLKEYESLSLPCKKEHSGGGKNPVVCPHKQTIMSSLKAIMDNRARKEHGWMRWPHPPLWVRCYDKTIYIFRKPWGVHLGNTTHPRYYIQQRDDPTKFENLWGVHK